MSCDRLAAPRALSVMLGLCAVVGAVVLAWSTPRGLGLSPDSVIYIGAARSLAAGRGFSLPTDDGGFAPISHYPPLYPALLAAGMPIRSDPAAVGLWLNLVCFAGVIGLIGLALWCTTASVGAAFTGAVATLTAFPIVLVHSMAWSEPLFLLLQLAGLALLHAAICRVDNRFLYLAGAAFGGAIAVRYAGVAALPAALLALGWLDRRPWREKWRAATLFLLLCAAPMALWWLRNYQLTSSGANRRLAVHLIGAEHGQALLNTISLWLVPLWSADPEISLLSLSCAAVIAGTWWLLTRPPPGPSANPPTSEARRWIALAAIYVTSYLATIVLTISFLDYQTPIDSRILAPVYLFVILGLTAALHAGPRPSRVITAVSMGLLLASQLALTIPWLMMVHDEGVGYASRAWADSALLRELRRMEPTAGIITNAPEVVYALLDRPSAMVPRKVDPATRQPNGAFAAQIDRLKISRQAGAKLVVWFNTIHWRWYLPTAGELEHLLNLQLILRTDDGAIYRLG